MIHNDIHSYVTLNTAVCEFIADYHLISLGPDYKRDEVLRQHCRVHKSLIMGYQQAAPDTSTRGYMYDLQLVYHGMRMLGSADHQKKSI